MAGFVKRKRERSRKRQPPPVENPGGSGLATALADWQCTWYQLGAEPWQLEGAVPATFLGHAIPPNFAPDSWLVWVDAASRPQARRLLSDALAGHAVSGELALRDAHHGVHRVRVALAGETQGNKTRLHLATVDRGEVIAPALALMIERLLTSFDRPDSLEQLCAAVAEALAARWAQLWEDCGSLGLRLLAQWGLAREEAEALHAAVLPRDVLPNTIARAAADLSTFKEESPAFHRGIIQLTLQRGQGRLGRLVVLRNRPSSGHGPEPRDLEAVERLATVWFAHASFLRELEDATRLKSDFVATMSHELRTPLNTLIGYTELLALGEFGPLNAEQRDVLERMDQSARELLTLINTTLDLSRFEQQTEPLQLGSVSIPALVEELKREMAQSCRKKGLALHSEIAPGAEQIGTDPAKLKTVLYHLLSNAIKFTERGWIEIRVHAAEGGVEFTVADTGIGIDSEILPVIFEPFRQGERASTRRFGGVGLGLYVVQQLVDMMGGQIQVESEPGKGSTFRVWLPNRLAPPSA